jgi:hypothetical protein
MLCSKRFLAAAVLLSAAASAQGGAWAPAQCAGRLLATNDGLSEADSGGFFNHRGEALPW